jgi:hypothetical protein
MSHADLGSVRAAVGEAATVAPGKFPVTVLEVLMLPRALLAERRLKPLQCFPRLGDPVLKRGPLDKRRYY